VNVKVSEGESDEVDFKEISQEKALDLLKVGLACVGTSTSSCIENIAFYLFSSIIYC